MPYVVARGELHLDGVVYRAGESVPAMKGSLSDCAAVGAVVWQDTRSSRRGRGRKSPAPNVKAGEDG